MQNKIQNISPLLAYYLIDVEANPIDVKEYSEFLNRNSGLLGSYYKYLGLLHDSWIIKTNLTKTRFDIVLNDFATHVFADALIEKKGLRIKHEELIFPIQLGFELHELSYKQVDDSGFITEIEMTEVHEYLYEQILDINDKLIKLALIVSKENKNKPDQNILILIDAKAITLIESQESAWDKLFEDKFKKYYNYFKSQMATGRFLSSQHLCDDLIEEYDSNRNDIDL